MAISHLCTGMTFRVLSDHRGAPISAIQSTSKEYGDLGIEGVELWLAASGDQRVSIWVSDWLQDRCELLEWLSFPAPALSEVRVATGIWVGIGICITQYNILLSVGSGPPAPLSCCLLPLG